MTPPPKRPGRRQPAPRKANRARMNRRRIVDSLCRWFDAHARELPWRKRRVRNGYTALVAETMLQQTQVARVVEAYTAFLRRFPDIQTLAAADEQEVLAMWRGLGYYRRAKNLHRAARMVVEEFSGKVPRTVEQLLRLPGVGRYTAGAIASIVHGLPVAIVDGNVQRVLMRWEGRMDRHGSAGALKWAWRMAARYVQDAARPGVFNEAMMELGAVICTPRNPRCMECPVARHCEARRRNVQDHIPRSAQRSPQRTVHHHAVAITRNGKVLVEQRVASANGKMWESMWQVPTLESERELSEGEIKGALPAKIHDLVKAATFDHHTTHRRIRFHVYRARTCSRSGEWHEWRTIDGLPMSNAQRRILDLMKP